MGCSSLFSKTETSVVGRPQASAIYHVAKIARQYDVPVIADGGVEHHSHISMAICLGASAVMCGSIFAATSESPGDSFWHNGQRIKLYSGHGEILLGCNKRTSNGPSFAFVERGSVIPIMESLLESVRRDLRRLGSSNANQLHEDLHASSLRFQVRTAACPGPRSATRIA